LATVDRSQLAVEGKSIIVSHAQFLHRLTRSQPFINLLDLKFYLNVKFVQIYIFSGKKRRINLHNYNRFHR